MAFRLYNGDKDFGDAWNFGPEERGESVEKIVDIFCELWGNKNGWFTVPSNDFIEAETLSLSSEKSKIQLGWQSKLDIHSEYPAHYAFPKEACGQE